MLKIVTKQNLDIFYLNGNLVEPDNMYTNVFSYGAYLGATMSWFKNFAVTFDSKWEPNGDDLMMTTYLDFLYAPSITIEDLLVRTEIISLEDIKKSPYGFRAGFKGKFNRTLGWGYGVETGVRPGIKENGFFFTFKLSFPIYGSRLEQTVDAVNTETGE